MTRPEILALLPYGDAFMFIDEAQLIDDYRISTHFAWTLARPEIAAHFPRGPHLVPAVLLAEQVAQSALLLARVTGRLAASDDAILGQLRCEVKDRAIAPCTIFATATIEARVASSFGFRGECSLEESEIARIRGIATKVAGKP